MATGAFAVMMLMKKYVPKLPGVLVVVAGATLISWATGFEQMGGKVVGMIPDGLPSIRMPGITAEWQSLTYTSGLISKVKTQY